MKKLQRESGVRDLNCGSALGNLPGHEFRPLDSLARPRSRALAESLVWFGDTMQSLVFGIPVPKPPEFFKGKGVTDDAAGFTYWKVTNGIRLTGMPGFSGSLSRDQMWQVSLLLANGDKLTATVGSILREPLHQSTVSGK